MSRLKIAIRIIAFALVFVFLFLKVQDKVTPTWDWPESQERLTRSISGVYQEDRNSVDILWLGTSHMQNGLSPMEIYRDTGLFSYNIATPAQPLQLTYYRLESALKEQSPRVIFLDASGFFASEYSNSLEARWLKTLACFPTSRMLERIKIAVSMPKLQTKHTKTEEATAAILPITRFHTNYMLTSDNFVDLHVNLPNIAKGHVIKTWVKPAGNGIVSDDPENTDADAAVEGSGSELIEKLKGRMDINYGALEKISQLCKTHGCELILTKVPVYPDTSVTGGIWSKEKHDITREVADKLGVKFLDLNNVDLGIDWTTDTCDGGEHLNEWGAIKASRYYAHWLMNDYGMTPTNDEKRAKAWDAQLAVYDDILSRFNIQLIFDFPAYIDQMDDGDYTLLCAVNGSVGNYWSEDIQKAFAKATGMKKDLYKIQTDNGGGAYVGAFVSGKPLKEFTKEKSCKSKGTLPDGRAFALSSATTNDTKSASIQIEGTEYAAQGRGMCIVVYDNQMHCVIDSKVFNTQNEVFTSARNSGFFHEFRAGVNEYEYQAIKAAGI